MKKFFRRLLYLIIFLALLGAALLYFFPLQDIATTRIKSALAAFGIKVNSVEIIILDSQQAVLSNLDIGDEPPLKIGQINVSYSTRAVIKGKFKSISLDALQANLYRKDSHWQIGGLEAVMKPSTDPEAKTALDFPRLQTLLPTKITVTNSVISTQDKDFQLTLPFDFELANIGQKIAGKFNSPKLIMMGLPYDIPPLEVKANYEFGADNITAHLEAKSAKKDYLLNLDLTAPTNDVMQGKVTLNQVQFAWGGGVVSAKAVQVPLNMKKPIKITLNLKKIDLETLLGSVSDGKITGQGRITGALPLTYHPDGSITLQKGNAAATDKGTLVISPELLPGDNQQLVTARETLQNFHYTTLKIAVSSDEQEQSVIQLSVEGSNPDANNGRTVKLNVNLSGDIIPLVQQSLLAINDLKQLLHIEEK